ncbi:MAG: neutral/alkaline non-lysosomal ceramidase N-terminal domain-containing protein [Victivallales bacterium]|nr:neutral/alkaline non-lysosomal ceramidase N-terminal domain-containing protein [Victivallales bacterium]
MKVGFGVMDITPRVGVQLYGFGPFLNRVSNRVRDRLEARAALFEDGDSRFLLITCDLCTLQPHTCDTVRQIICDAVPRLKPQEIMVECAHTHSGPSTVDGDFGWGAPDGPYNEILPYKIAQAGIDACMAPEEGTLSSALVPCRHIGLNRVYDKDAPPLDEVLKPDWEPAHPELTDTQCRVIRFDNKQGIFKGFWAYFGCHPVVCCQQTHAIHGDYPAVAIHKLMSENPGVIGLFLQGAQGDVNSGCVHKPEEASMAALDIFAERFASAIRNGLAEAKPISDAPIRVISRKYDFTTRPLFTKDKLIELKAEFEKALHSPNADELDYKVRMAKVKLIGVTKMLENLDAGLKPIITAEVQCARIGDLEFLGAPFEIMQAIKNDVHAGAKSPQPMVMGLCNGSLGYAPDNTQLQRDTYESYTVAFMMRRLPFANIHNELVEYMLGIDKELNA